MTWDSESCPRKINKGYDVNAMLAHVLPQMLVTWMPSQGVATTSEPHAKGYSQLSYLDEVDVASMSCLQQPYVRYNSSIITKRYIVIVVLYDMF